MSSNHGPDHLEEQDNCIHKQQQPRARLNSERSQKSDASSKSNGINQNNLSPKQRKKNVTYGSEISNKSKYLENGEDNLDQTSNSFGYPASANSQFRSATMGEDLERNGADGLSASQHLSSSSDNLIDTGAPRDRYKLVCIGFIILGITTLLPWNFFITATDYWMFKFRNVSNEYHLDETQFHERTSLQTFFESYLAIAANFPMLLSMIINSLYAQRFSQKRRLYVSLSVMMLVFALTTGFVKVNTDNMQTNFFIVTMIMVILISFFSATFQAAIFGIVANFPDNYMHAMVNGQAVAGLLAVAIQVFSMLNDTGPISSGLWYFSSSTVFLAFAIFCYWMMDNDYSRHYLLKLPDEDQLSTSLSVNFIESKSELLESLKDCWPMALSVVLAFWASLAVFPGVCVLVVPQNPYTSIFTGRFFVPITTFLLFNCGDLAGRMCSSYITFPTEKKNSLLVVTISRAFLPFLILFCNVQPRHNFPVLFTNDIFFPIFISLTALTNGYVFSSAMVMASRASRKCRLEMTGFIMATSLGLGLTLGSVTSTILLRII